MGGDDLEKLHRSLGNSFWGENSGGVKGAVKTMLDGSGLASVGTAEGMAGLVGTAPDMAPQESHVHQNEGDKSVGRLPRRGNP